MMGRLRNMQKTRLKIVWGTLSTGWEPFGVVLPNVRGGRRTRPRTGHEPGARTLADERRRWPGGAATGPATALGTA